MTHIEFDDLIKSRFHKSVETMRGKAVDYATDEERLQNFYDGAELMMITPEQYLLTLVTKHWLAIRDAVVQNANMDRVWVEEKVGDVINYMILLEALRKEAVCD
jgi:hypothetical protein